MENMDVPVSALVSRYAQLFHTAKTGADGVTSPLGAWLLLALLAPATSGNNRVELETVLGTSAHEAHTAACQLLNNPHPAVALALAAWARPDVLSDAFRQWETQVKDVAEVAEMPTAEGAAVWAQESTNGLIKSFPLAISRDTALVFANALASRTSWSHPFSVAPAELLGGPFGKIAAAVLESQHHQFIANTTAAGLVGAHVAKTQEGLLFVSVIADRDVSPSAVQRAAYEIVELLSGDESHATKVSLFDLPAGPGSAWFIDELGPELSLDETTPSTGGVEEVLAYLPAWSTSTRTNLLTAPGIATCVEQLEEFVASEYKTMSVVAHQDVTATFNQYGFNSAESAQNTNVAYLAPPPPETHKRTATLRFNHPYAVIACVRTPAADTSTSADPWDSIPVFAAWVTGAAIISPITETATVTPMPTSTHPHNQTRPKASLAARKGRRNLWRIAIARLNQDPSTCAHAASELFATLGIGFDAGLAFAVDTCTEFLVSWADTTPSKPTEFVATVCRKVSGDLTAPALLVLNTANLTLQAQAPATSDSAILSINDIDLGNTLQAALKTAAFTPEMDTTSAMGAYIATAEVLLKLAWVRAGSDAEKMAALLKEATVIQS